MARRRLRWWRAIRSLPLGAQVLAATIAIAGCGIQPASPSPPSSPQSPPSSPPPERTAEIAIRVELAEDGGIHFFVRDVHAQVRLPDGTILDRWRLGEAGGVLDVPAGTIRLEVWSVLLSDVIACGRDPVSARETCGPATLAPGHVCERAVEVAERARRELVYRVLADERCELLEAPGSSS